MKNVAILSAAAALGLIPFTTAQIVNWCKDEDCGDCPSSVISGESRWPECVVYDTETVFGGQGFPEGSGGNLLYEVFGSYADAPCGDEGPGAVLIRSPASLATVGCGNLKKWRKEPGCDNSPIELEETFMVQYCCGFQECVDLGIPYDKKRNILIGGHTPRSPLLVNSGGAGARGLYLQFKNGTIIPPKEVGNAPERKKVKARCDGWEEDSYAANGEPYFKTFDTDIVGEAIAPSDEDRTIEIRHSRSVETRTTFDVSVGDPFGIISASVGFEFATTETQEITYPLLVPAGVSGRAGFTPVYICTKGTLRDCDGNTTGEEESCTAWVNDNGDIQGDWQVVEA